MNDDTNPWEIKGSQSWKLLREAELLVTRNNGDTIAKYEFGKSITQSDIDSYTKKLKVEVVKVYKALITGEGGEYGLKRDWQYNDLLASNYQIGNIIEVGWTLPRGNLRGDTIRLYFVVLLDKDNSKIFCRFAEKGGREATYFNPVEREMKHGYRGDED